MTTAFVTPNGFGFLAVTVRRRGQEETVTAEDAAIELSAAADMSRASRVSAGPRCLAANAAALGLPRAVVGRNKATLPRFFFATMLLLKKKKKRPLRPRVARRANITARAKNEKKKKTLITRSNNEYVEGSGV